MEDVRLPIDVVPNTDPPRFRWRQTVDTLNGRRVVDHEGPLPPSVEVAVARIVTIAKQLLHDNAVLHGTIKGLTNRVAAQSELLERKAEKVEPTAVVQQASSKKSRG